MTTTPTTGAFGPALETLVRTHVREVEGFPEPGVLFRDISPVLGEGPVLGATIETIAEHYRGKVEAVAGLESRGFILAAPLAIALGTGMIIVRKAGKLPPPVLGIDYELEYGTARFEVSPRSVTHGQKVLVIDDVLATGGTAAAAADLLESAGAEIVALTMLLELSDLDGRSRLEGRQVDSVVVY